MHTDGAQQLRPHFWLDLHVSPVEYGYAAGSVGVGGTCTNGGGVRKIFANAILEASFGNPWLGSIIILSRLQHWILSPSRSPAMLASWSMGNPVGIPSVNHVYRKACYRGETITKIWSLSLFPEGAALMAAFMGEKQEELRPGQVLL